MLPLRHVRRWRWAGAALLVLVLAATLMPAVWLFPDRREFMDWFVDVDKWLHAMTFAFLAVWFSGQYRPNSYWRIALGLVLFGLMIEGCQRLVTYRSAEWFDIVADAAGILAGLGIALAGMGGWSLRVEGWLSRRKAGAGIE
jgi:VanZ family protein